MTKLTCALALALLAPSLASANELTRVYQLAVDNDTQVRAARGARDAAVAANPRARGALLPQITGAASTYKGDETSNFNNTGDVDADTDSTDITLRVRQALFDAAAWNRWQSAGRQAAAAQATYLIAEQNLALRVTEAYFALLAASDSVRFADAEKKAVERQLELAKKRFEVGLSAITDVQEAQARFDLTVAQQIEAEQALTIAQVALAEITGADARVVPLRDEIPLLGPDPGDVSQWLKAAADGNLSIRVAQANADAADQDLDAAWAGHYPTLSLVGSKSIGDSSSVSPPPIGSTEREYDSLTYGIELSVPIFAGGSTQAAVSSARGTRDQRAAELEARKRETERSTRVAYQGVVAGVSRVKALQQAVVSNTTALEASEVGLEVGARTAVDVLNAQRELYRAQRDYARSRYDYLLNVLRLKNAAGQLSPKDVTEVDGLLGAEAAPAAPAEPTEPATPESSDTSG